MIIRRKELVTTNVLFFIPHTHILQSLVWQVDDTVPDLPRVRKYLDHWRREIDAIISEVFIAVGAECRWRHFDIEVKTLN